jgi:hypothetical protein
MTIIESALLTVERHDPAVDRDEAQNAIDSRVDQCDCIMPLLLG